MTKNNIEKTVYFVRHGQSVGNISPVFQSTDSPLSPDGRLQAHKIAPRAAKLQFDVIITSPVARAIETAEVIASVAKKAPETSSLFVERIKPTSLNGASYDDAQASDMWGQWNKSLYTSGMRVADGENYDDIVKRADDALNFLKNRDEKSILVVTHGYFFRAIMAKAIMGDLLTDDIFRCFQDVLPMDNTGLSVLRYASDWEGNFAWRLWGYNDHSHLAD